jgi:hypothetical protein
VGERSDKLDSSFCAFIFVDQVMNKQGIIGTGLLPESCFHLQTRVTQSTLILVLHTVLLFTRGMLHTLLFLLLVATSAIPCGNVNRWKTITKRISFVSNTLLLPTHSYLIVSLVAFSLQVKKISHYLSISLCRIEPTSFCFFAQTFTIFLLLLAQQKEEVVVVVFVERHFVCRGFLCLGFSRSEEAIMKR